MARFNGLEPQRQAASGNDPHAAEPRTIRISRPEEGDGTGDGWAAVGSLLLLIGGMVIVSYLIFT